jgi:hypothetical protein
MFLRQVLAWEKEVVDSDVRGYDSTDEHHTVQLFSMEISV